MRFVGRESNGHKHINEFFEKLTPSIQVAMLLEQENISRLCNILSTKSALKTDNNHIKFP